MERSVQLVDIVACVATCVVAFFIMFLSAHLRGFHTCDATKKAVIFVVGVLIFIVIALFFLSWIQNQVMSWRALLFHCRNIRRLPRVFLTASTYMYVVWQQNILHALRNGLIFTAFSFLAFPLFERIFDVCGV